MPRRGRAVGKGRGVRVQVEAEWPGVRIAGEGFPAGWEEGRQDSPQF